MDNSVTVDRLRAGIDDILIRLHPRITYHLGTVDSTNFGSMIAEFIAEGSKELIATHLKKLEGQMPLAIESLDWGWSTDKDTIPEINQSLRQDPLANIKPAASQITFNLNKSSYAIRYSVMLSLAVALVSLLVANFYLDRSLLDLTYIIAGITWLLWLNEIPLDIRRYAAKIECNQTNVKITYWIRKKVEVIDWQTLWGMEYDFQACKLYHHGKTEYFLLTVKGGRKEKETMLKTLIERSALNFVETNLRKTVYKRHDAPDQ